LILLAEPLPTTYRRTQIEDLRRSAPLAEIIIVAGTWCEGELRTGKPQAGVLRLYWYEFAAWWQARIKACSPCLDGPFAPRSGTPLKALKTSVAIQTATLAAYEAFEGSLGAFGAECRWIHNSDDFESTAIGIWDGGQLDPSEWDRLENFALKLQQKGSALVVLLDFPRKEHVTRLKTLGCNSVFGKPYIVAELVMTLGELC
jgi:hypothetical protein